MLGIQETIATSKGAENATFMIIAQGSYKLPGKEGNSSSSDLIRTVNNIARLPTSNLNW